MKVKEMVVAPCGLEEVREFIEKWHYSKNVNGLSITQCFKLTYQDEIIGAAIFGRIAMAGVWKKYVEKEEDIIELRRLCCIDDTPKNTESYFIGKCLKWLVKFTNFKKVISYADLDFGHHGVIYQATNFELVGRTQKGRVIIYNGKRYHDKTIRTKYKGELKPFAKRIKEALETGEAYYVKTKGKNIYLYDLEKRRKHPNKVKKETCYNIVVNR